MELLFWSAYLVFALSMGTFVARLCYKDMEDPIPAGALGMCAFIVAPLTFISIVFGFIAKKWQ